MASIVERHKRKAFVPSFFRRTKCSPMRCNIGKRLKMIELARQRTDRQGAAGGISNSGIYGVPAIELPRFSPLRPAERKPDLYRSQHGCIAAPTTAIRF